MKNNNLFDVSVFKIARSFFIVFVLIILIFSISRVEAGLNASSGLISDQVWYSSLPLTEGKTVNIYTAVWNGEEHPLTVKVEFYDKKVILGNRELTLKPQELKNVYIPWKVTVGEHLISAKIIKASLDIRGENEKIVLTKNTTKQDKKSVSLLIKNILGASVAESDIIKDKIEDTTTKISDKIPDNIKNAITNIYKKIDDYRLKIYEQVNKIKIENKEKIDKINNSDSSNNNDKYITYTKYYLFLILAFILASRLIFYGLIILIIFFILRTIFRR